MNASAHLVTLFDVGPHALRGKPVLTHIGSPALGPAEMVQCPDCHEFSRQGVGCASGTGAQRVKSCQNRGGPVRHLPSVQPLLSHAAKDDTPH